MGDRYDWRKVEAKLNALPQFITEIDGLDIHFIHVRSKHENALPLIVTHGWPGSVTEQMKIIDPLTNPTAHGGNASDAFHLVIPSIPGYGYSGKPTTTGWDPAHIARAWVVLMKRLGYTKFVAQGGDWGAVITELMGVQAPPELLGIHTNMPGIFPADIDGAAFSGAPAPSGLSADEKLAYDRLQFVYQKGIAYGYQMGLRPQTLYGIADSPVGLAAYFLDHDARSYELIARVFDGQSEGLTRDDILDNITFTWLTNTALSGARLYWEYWGKGYFNAKGVSIPVAVSVFPDELYPAPRSWAERAYPKLIHYNKVEKGGHFAAWEQPRTLFRRGSRGPRITAPIVRRPRVVEDGTTWSHVVSILPRESDPYARAGNSFTTSCKPASVSGACSARMAASRRHSWARGKSSADARVGFRAHQFGRKLLVPRREQMPEWDLEDHLM